MNANRIVKLAEFVRGHSPAKAICLADGLMVGIMTTEGNDRDGWGRVSWKWTYCRSVSDVRNVLGY